jgi:hypothetical protein
LPHEPQFSGSLVVSMQPSPHATKGAEHDVTHDPL